jgi:hypothetical protein
MPVSRVELQRLVGKLDADMRDLILHYPQPAEFLAEFNGHSEFILKSARTTDYEWARGEVDRILRKFGFNARTQLVPQAADRDYRVSAAHG